MLHNLELKVIRHAHDHHEAGHIALISEIMICVRLQIPHCFDRGLSCVYTLSEHILTILHVQCHFLFRSKFGP